MPRNNNRIAFPWRLEPLLDDAPDIPVAAPSPFTPGKTGEELFHLILSGIREVYDLEGVCIAGGAVRDVAAGVSDHTDVDVFIPTNYDDFTERFVELGWSGALVKQKKAKNYKGVAKKADGSFKFTSNARAFSYVQGKLVDLVFIDKPLAKEDVETFPIHAQRCVWTLDKGLFMSPEAKKDIEDKTFTIDPTITNKDVIARLLEKIEGWKKGPYKDWKIVEPETKEWWEVKKTSEEAKKADERMGKKLALNKNPFTQQYVEHIEKWWDGDQWPDGMVRLEQ